MHPAVQRRLSCFLALAACAFGAEIRGVVLDPSRAAVAGAQVSAVGRVGVVAQTYSGPAGAFELRVPESNGLNLMVTKPGFATRTVPAAETEIQLEIAAQVDSVRVVGSAMDVPLSE